ncbi:MAG: UPF0179 family protein [Thermoplasmatota archaeon]
MVAVTLVGERLAKEGGCFVFLGPLAECRDCRLKTVCFNLDEGRTYIIKTVRSVRHDCRVHEGGVRVVEVEREPIRAALEPRLALEGTSLQWEERTCDNLGCPNRRVCFPRGARAGERYRVVRVTGFVECPDGRQLKEAALDT